MSSHSAEAGTPHSAAATWFRLLDPTFGYLVWTVHFLVVYVGAAVACVLGLGSSGKGAQTAFLATLAAVTAAALALLAAHAARRYRQHRGVADRQLRLSVTLGNDALAAVAVAWQLFPILLAPVCA